MRSLAVKLVLVWIAVTLGEPAHSAPRSEEEPAAVDITPLKGRLRVFHDGKGHYLVVAAPGHGSALDAVFYGDGKVFYRQPVVGASRKGVDLELTIPDPRILAGSRTKVFLRINSGSRFILQGGKASYHCELRKTDMALLGTDPTNAILAQGKFLEVGWTRAPHLLARDTSGVYYYVDRLRQLDVSRGSLLGFRVFAGPRGKMKQLRMKNVVNDAQGEIFITPGGKLRLVVDAPAAGGKQRATWIVGRRQTELTIVDVRTPLTVGMIYRDLGVYLGQKLRRPCDDL